jgi:Ran GTPase-activating protein (RanGAP) involved in mRNA processing and transport
VEAVAVGALQQLRVLYLDDNQIGDAGVSALGEACSAHQALAKLTVLSLQSNRISSRAIQVLADTAARGGLGQLSSLDLRHNWYIGDASANSFVDICCTSGALPALKSLHIGARALFKHAGSPPRALAGLMRG